MIVPNCVNPRIFRGPPEVFVILKLLPAKPLPPREGPTRLSCVIQGVPPDQVRSIHPVESIGLGTSMIIELAVIAEGSVITIVDVEVQPLIASVDVQL